MDDIFWPIYPIIVSGVGFVSFKYPLQMRKLLYYGIGVTLGLSVFIFTYGWATNNAYEDVFYDIKNVRNIKVVGADTSFINNKIDIAQSTITALQVQSLSFIEGIAKYCIYATYFLLAMVIVTYLAAYLEGTKAKKKE